MLTVAEPDIAPAAPAWIADFTCSGVDIPKPISGGATLYFSNLATSSAAGNSTADSVPVTPARPYRYVYPLDLSPI